MLRVHRLLRRIRPHPPPTAPSGLPHASAAPLDGATRPPSAAVVLFGGPSPHRIRRGVRPRRRCKGSWSPPPSTPHLDQREKRGPCRTSVEEARRQKEGAHEAGAPYGDDDDVAAPPALRRPISATPLHGATTDLREPSDLKCVKFIQLLSDLKYVKFSQPPGTDDHSAAVWPQV